MLARKLKILCLPALILSGCITRQEIKSEIWMQSGLPPALCAAHPEIARSGIYRRLNDDVCLRAHKKIPCYEVVSYCRPEIAHYYSILDSRLEEILDALLPKEKR